MKTMTVAAAPPASLEEAAGRPREGWRRRRCTPPASSSLPGPPPGRYALSAGAGWATLTCGGSLAEVARVPLATAQRPSLANDGGEMALCLWKERPGRRRTALTHEGTGLVILKKNSA